MLEPPVPQIVYTAPPVVGMVVLGLLVIASATAKKKKRAEKDGS
jgi:hypothetical protein